MEICWLEFLTARTVSTTRLSTMILQIVWDPMDMGQFVFLEIADFATNIPGMV